ncbi:MAG: hypothetical protein RIR83_241, partial [Pseudomonadota bacterium]
MIINCVAYQNGLKIADLSFAQISDYLSRPGVFVWVALKDPTESELRQMQIQFNLHDLAIEDVRHGHQRPKTEEYGDIIFSVAQLIEVSPSKELIVGEIDVFTGPNFILSTRKNSRRDFLGVRARCETQPELLRLGSPYVLYALVDYVVDQ